MAWATRHRKGIAIAPDDGAALTAEFRAIVRGA